MQRWWLTENDPAVLSVHFEQPRLGGLGPVVDELLQAPPVHLQRVLVGEPAEGLDDYRGSGVGAPHGESFLSNQLEHPVFSDDFLSRTHVACLHDQGRLLNSANTPNFLTTT